MEINTLKNEFYERDYQLQQMYFIFIVPIKFLIIPSIILFSTVSVVCSRRKKMSTRINKILFLLLI